MLSGNVDIRQVDLGFRVPGRIGSIAFEEGAHVTAGAVLARLDAAPYQAAAAAAQAQVEVDKALLDKLHNGNRKEDIDQAAASLTEAQATREQARLDYERNSALVKNSAVSRQSFDQARAQYQVAQAREQAASAALTLMRAGARIEDIAAGEAQLQLALAQQQKAETDLADTTLRAPNAGTILVRAREPGATVAAGETVLTLTIDHPMRIRAYIDEPNLHRISPGMTVEVTADNNPKVYHGTIGFISPTAEFTPKTVQTQALRADLVFRLRVIVDHPDDALRQGAPVTVMVPNARPPGS
ncbi:MAG TPA: HlyD family efflux transporter periplasmic adaptor subunit [Rhodopila sp.]|jgi:HlyD family secretion protein|nr:HlyD family efflux transporter periplasmic adaptor subunit [Rhodopila sp.]